MKQEKAIDDFRGNLMVGIQDVESMQNKLNLLEKYFEPGLVALNEIEIVGDDSAAEDAEILKNNLIMLANSLENEKERCEKTLDSLSATLEKTLELTNKLLKRARDGKTSGVFADSAQMGRFATNADDDKISGRQILERFKREVTNIANNKALTLDEKCDKLDRISYSENWTTIISCEIDEVNKGAISGFLKIHRGNAFTGDDFSYHAFNLDENGTANFVELNAATIDKDLFGE